MAAAMAHWDDQAGVGWAARDDAELVALAQTDREAFGALYDRYVDRIYAYCYRRLQTRSTAEDATSMTFLKALGALPSYRPETPSTFRAWLFTIAHRVTVDAYRSTRPMVSLDSVGELAATALGPAVQGYPSPSHHGSPQGTPLH